ncbi:hypothetical protein [Henriciella pelagia]|jgi:predicted flap endonuclease-1-like 5' DNA nuclease/uncharacterized coiled-coil protein SlyX|uniref:NADH-quinone oxidoreductase subunit E n=1 Tax=Henriciella pelagia TaxID=1977912 RepID=A0ABQ1J8N6_9PROT|nr:hypothetical protein [Henriciella pelagia]GGB62798.1 hypothetical protein GCM10011503_09310 [Henriciella pelagia]
MEFVMEYIWFVMGGAAVLAFLLAWIIRGAMGASSKRRASVERDIAITELEQVRGELDSLYAAQRKQRESAAGSSEFAVEIRERDEQIQRMASELSAAKASLASLRQGSPAQSVEAAPSVDMEELQNLQSRNAYLEERVGELEAKVHELGQVAAETPTTATETGGESDRDKLVWQVNYLKSRVAALEEQVVEAAPAPQAAPPPAQADTSATDEELARLRWRNRYLEGRLAYFEERPDSAEDEAIETASEPLEVAQASPATQTEEKIADDISGDEASDDVPDADVSSIETQAEDSDEAEADVQEDDGVHPADKMLEALDAKDAAETERETVNEVVEGDADEAAELEQASDEEAEASEGVEGVQPAALDKPNGEPDDLTLITGIGPRIQTILNDYGIWHFSQIAEWTDDNEIWIDRQLNFAGRVSREGWINQARELTSVNSDS